MTTRPATAVRAGMPTPSPTAVVRGGVAKAVRVALDRAVLDRAVAGRLRGARRPDEVVKAAAETVVVWEPVAAALGPSTATVSVVAPLVREPIGARVGTERPRIEVRAEMALPVRRAVVDRVPVVFVAGRSTEGREVRPGTAATRVARAGAAGSATAVGRVARDRLIVVAGGERLAVSSGP